MHQSLHLLIKCKRRYRELFSDPILEWVSVYVCACVCVCGVCVCAWVCVRMSVCAHECVCVCEISAVWFQWTSLCVEGDIPLLCMSTIYSICNVLAILCWQFIHMNMYICVFACPCLSTVASSRKSSNQQPDRVITLDDVFDPNFAVKTFQGTWAGRSGCGISLRGVIWCLFSQVPWWFTCRREM